ncbi:MAG: GNAT family N-acetyltransferase [Cytophagales bacterium]|nr:GNAT family N-acetyltransferase [Armatimonadota bacterium]
MDVHESSSLETLTGQHARDWARIADASPTATLFQTWEWTEAWWRHHGAGKRLVALVFREGGVTVGFAALFMGAFPSALRTLRFVGNGGSDYLDLLAAPGFEEQVSRAFRAFLWEQRRRWDWVDLQQLAPGAVALRGADTGPASPVRAESWIGETCPFLPLAPSWDAFRAVLPKKLRQNIGYYARALEKQYLVEYRLADAETLEADLSDFFELHQRRWNQRWLPGAFASRQARAFHTDAARALLQTDRLRLFTLFLDGETRASLYCFHKGTVCYYYLGGFEPSLARLSLGTVLTAHAMRHAIEQDGAAEFDFLRGNEGYKYRWGARDRHNTRLSLTRPGARPLLLSRSGQVSLALEQRFKTWMHHRHGGAGKAAIKDG